MTGSDSRVITSLVRPDLPLTFRREIVPHIFAAIHGGWSVALVGLHGCGMSNLLRFVCERRVSENYLGIPSRNFLFVYVDDNLIRDYSEAGFCRAVVDANVQAARQSEWSEPELGPFIEAARRYPEYERQMGGLGILARIFDIVCREKRKRVALIIDGFDQAFLHLDARVLRGLRAIRDDHKDWLSFVIATRVELSQLANQRGVKDWESGIRQCWTLFEQHTFAVGPYRREDAADLIARKIFDAEEGFSPNHIDLLIRSSGGYASLLMAGLNYLRPRHDAPLADRETERGLRRDPEVDRCCRDIWADLDNREQLSMMYLVTDRRGEVPQDSLRLLRLKGLVVGYPPSIFSPLFEGFVKSHVDDREIDMEGSDSMSPPAIAPSVLRDPETRLQW